MWTIFRCFCFLEVRFDLPPLINDALIEIVGAIKFAGIDVKAALPAISTGVSPSWISLGLKRMASSTLEYLPVSNFEAMQSASVNQSP